MTTRNIDHLRETALEHHQAGRLDEAEQVYRQMLGQRPEPAASAGIYCNLANALMDKGQVNEAIIAYRQAIACDPSLPDAHYNLGIALSEIGRPEEAIVAYRSAITLRPNDAAAHNNLGNALTDSKKLDEAIAAYRRAIALAPDNAEAFNNLGNALTDTGRLDEAVVAYRHAIALRPDDAETYINLAHALIANGHLDEAIVACTYAISIDPNIPEAHSNLGNAWKLKGQISQAIAAYGRAIALRPEFAEAYGNLGNALKDQGKLDDAIAAYRTAIDLNPESAQLHSALVYAVGFHPHLDSRQILEEARAWARRHAEPSGTVFKAHDNDRSPDRRLRVGYVSPDFRDHVVGRNVLPLLENHDHSEFEIFCYSNLKIPDDLTRQFRQTADHWRDVTGISDADLANRIRRDHIDILVDLTLHMAGSRLGTFALKPAPVQVTWAGYPGTTGLAAIDYRLTDPYLDPPGHGDEVYCEKSIRLPNSFWCFRPAKGTPEVNSLPALKNHFVTFGCLNNFCKVTELALELWVRTLQKVDHSHLVILAPHGDHREKIVRQFESAGIRPNRLEFINHLPFAEYIRRYHSIDIALDPFPYTGHSTSLDAFWMGVPVVTLSGETVASRGGVSIANNIGLPELIATSPDHYAEIASGLADELVRLAGLRSSLRKRMLASPLMDEKGFARDIERCYRAIWQAWCSHPT